MASPKNRIGNAAGALVGSCEPMYKDDIKDLPDLERCDFYEFDIHSYSEDMQKIGIYFHRDDIFLGVLRSDGQANLYRIMRKAKTTSDFQNSLLMLASSLKGDEFEKSFTHSASKKNPSSASWSEKLRFEKTFLFYEEIHEYITDTLVSILKMVKFHPPKNYRVLDIFGGDGRLINRLCDRIRRVTDFESITFDFIYVDSDDEMFERAVNTFSTIEDDQFRIRPFRSDLRMRKKPELGTVDLVLCSGGLTGEVIGPDDAFTITQWIYEKLKTTGIFIATGKADSHIDKRILSRIGFYVSNCAMIDQEVKYGIIHHYVCMKQEQAFAPQESLASQLLTNVLHG